MKTLTIVLLTFLVAHNLSAQSAALSFEKKSVVVDNLIQGIESENSGLHTSAALVLSELISKSYLESVDASKALIPLLRMLDTGKTDEERIVAALALYQLGSGIGINRLKYASRFDDSDRVAKVCRNLYVNYHLHQG